MLSDPNWEKVVPKVQEGYIAFKHTMAYLGKLAGDKQLMRDEIQKKCGITDKKEFNLLFSSFDKLPGQVPKIFLGALEYRESDLKEAYEKDVVEWNQEISKITKFSDEYEFTTHTFYMLHKRYPDHLKTIDEKLEYLVELAKNPHKCGFTYHCCIDLYPLLQIYFRRGGEIIVTGRKPLIKTDETILEFYEGSGDIILPEFLKDSKIISETEISNYWVRFGLSIKGRNVPMIQIDGKNVRNL